MFNGPFLDKQAAIPFRRPMPGGGKFVHNQVNDSRILPYGDSRFYGADELEELNRKKNDADGNGMFGDLAIGAIGMVSPKTKEFLQRNIHKGKNKVQEVSARMAKPLAGDNPDSLRGRFFSTPVSVDVGEITDDLGKKHILTNTKNRQLSILAPAQNAAKVSTPLLASMYVGDKLYPGEQEKQSSFHEDGYEKESEEIISLEMDKQAALHKVAQLEEELEKTATKLEEVKKESNRFWKQAEEERLNSSRILLEKTAAEKELEERKTAHKKIQLRMAAKERSKSAVKIAESLLDGGLIKQAEFDGQVDRLMDCDEATFKLYTSMAKQASQGEKTLESSAYLVDDRINENSKTIGRKSGLSKKGQTIGQAAEELTNKR